MSYEYSIDYPYEKRTFISKLNPESPPFHPSSYYQHIQEISPSKISSQNNTNHLHIQPILNDQYNNQNYYSTSIHSIEPSDYVSSQRHFIQEIISDNQSTITSSHIEPVNISHNDLFKQSISQTKEDNINNENKENTNQNFSQQLTNTNTKPTLNENPNELKGQHELDENDIPSTDITVNPSSTFPENNISSSELKSNIMDSNSTTELELSSSIPDIDAKTSEPEPDDVLGNKSLLKHVITPGTPDTRPIRNSLATVSYKLFLIDNSTSDSRLIETITNESFFIGEYDILPAIDITIQLMDRGEHAIIDSDVRHCYGEIGWEEKQIPPVSSNNSYRMKIDIEFHDWKDPIDIQTLSIDQRLHWGDKKRERGNFLYRRKEYSTALQCYRNALKFLNTNEYPLIEENPQSSILLDKYIQVENNLAQVYLLNNQYEECLNTINDILKYDSNNIKALFRQAKALFELGKYDETIKPLKLLLKNPSKDVEKDKVNEMLQICETKLAKYQKNEKEIYKRMFQSKSSNTEKSTTKNIQKIENKTNHSWWTYVAMGSAVVVGIGLAAIIKYR